MGERGPLPKLQSTRSDKRPVKGVIATGKPKMPANLPAEAKSEWRRIVPILDGIGILASIDRATLIRYCSAWAEWVELDAQVARTGKVIQGRDGNLVRNPLWMIRRDTANELNALAAQLGLTPAARLRNNIKHEPAPEQRRVEQPREIADFEAERRKRLIDAG